MAKMPGVSETSRIRSIAMNFINPPTDKGVDIGFGGDAITWNSINVDLPQRYANCGGDPQHISTDARDLSMIPDNDLDYIFSSHCLEDFPDTRPVVEEWLRVLKPSGKLILYLPNQQWFEEWCMRTGQPSNPHHENPDMGLEWFELLLEDIGKTKTIFTIERHWVPSWVDGVILDYSFFIVTEKL